MTSKNIRETIIKTRNEIIDNIIMILSTRPGLGIIFNKKNHASITNCSGGVCELKSIHLKDTPPIIINRICQALPSDDKLIIKTYLNKDFSENDFDIEELLKLLEIVASEANEYEERIEKNSKRYWKLTDLASWIENNVFNGQHFGYVNDTKYWVELISKWGFVDFYEAIQDSIDHGYLKLSDKLVFLDEIAGEFFGFETSEELYDYFEEEIKDVETDIAAKLKSNSI